MDKRTNSVGMDFLMAYGWAILVVLVSIGALAYFEVLNLDNFKPNKCNCYAVNMTTGGKIIDGNITYIECFDSEPYLDYEAKKIRFNSTYQLFYCNESSRKLVALK